MPAQTDRNDIIRPGFLISLKTTLIGNISYHKQVLEREHVDADGSEKARWETLRVIGDREEHNAGRKAQAEARAKVTQVCTNTAFGLLCPEDNAAELQAAIAEAKAVAAEFNRTARLSRVNIYVIVGKIATDRFDVVGAMAAEALELLNALLTGIRNRDAGEIRTAANELRKLGDMFSEPSRGQLKVAIDAARTAARKIVKTPGLPASDIEAESVLTITNTQRRFQQLADSGAVSLQPAV